VKDEMFHDKERVIRSQSTYVRIPDPSIPFVRIPEHEGEGNDTPVPQPPI